MTTQNWNQAANDFISVEERNTPGPGGEDINSRKDYLCLPKRLQMDADRKQAGSGNKAKRPTKKFYERNGVDQTISE